jgi:ubiquinone/menaquinone biosynthesis C-methylase UbiE
MAGQEVLDFGCGSGTYTIPAGKLVGEAGRVYALDVSVTALDRMEKRACEEGLKNIMRIDASGDGNIQLEDETLDHILLIDVLQEIENREALFDEVYRTLKAGGIMTVYPMHMAEEEVIRLAANRSLNLEEKKFNRILIFREPTQEQPSFKK